MIIILGVHSIRVTEASSSSSSSHGSTVPGPSLTPPDYWWSSEDPNDDDNDDTLGSGGGGGDSSSDWDWGEDVDDPSLISPILPSPPLPEQQQQQSHQSPPSPMVLLSLDPLTSPLSVTSTTTTPATSSTTIITTISPSVVQIESVDSHHQRLAQEEEKQKITKGTNGVPSSKPAPSAFIQSATTTTESVSTSAATLMDDEPGREFSSSSNGGGNSDSSSSDNDENDIHDGTSSMTMMDAIISNKPLQTLEKLQQMLDETDYLTTSRRSTATHPTIVQPQSSLPIAPPAHATMEEPNQHMAMNTKNAATGSTTIPPTLKAASLVEEFSLLPATKSLWTSKDRSKYKRQQRNARASSRSSSSSSSSGSNSRASPDASAATASHVNIIGTPSTTAATTSAASTTMPAPLLQNQPPRYWNQQQQQQQLQASNSWPTRTAQGMSLDAAVTSSSSDLVEDPSDTDDGLGYTLPNLPVYLSDDEGDHYSEAATGGATGFNQEEVAAASARAAAAAATDLYPQQQQQFQNPSMLQQQQPPMPPIMYPGYPYATSSTPQWATSTSPPPQAYGYYPPPQMHSQQQYYVPPPPPHGAYPPGNVMTGNPPQGYFYPQQYLPPTPTLTSRYIPRITNREFLPSQYYDPRRQLPQDPSSSFLANESSTSSVTDRRISIEQPLTNSDAAYRHSHVLPVGGTTVSVPFDEWQHSQAHLTGQFQRTVGSLIQISICLILSTVVCYAAVSPQTLPFLEYNQKFYEILKIASLTCIPPMVVSALVVDRASIRLSHLVNGFYYAFTIGYVVTFVLEILWATLIRLAVFAIWEPNVFDMTPQVPLITVPWVLRDQKYLVKPITLIVQDLVTSVAICPLMEEWIKLVIFKAVIPRGRYEIFGFAESYWYMRKTDLTVT